MENDRSAAVAPPIAEELALAAETSGVTPANASELPAAVSVIDEPQKKVSAWHLTLLVLANFGAGLAFIVPLAYTLALKIDQLAPGQESLLGIATGIASAVVVLTGPLIGMWSDRTRSHLGRRRPFMIAGVIIGLIALAVIAVTDSVPVVIVVWTVANFGWGMVLSSIGAIQADRLPDSQRGKTGGLIGMSAQIAPILGIGMAYTLKGAIVPIFLLPAIIGTILIALYLFFGGEKSSRDLPKAARLSVRDLFGSYVFSVRKFPDFSWNLLGRFLFFMGLYANTSFATFFYAQRMDVPVAEVAGVAATIGALGVLAGAIGAVAGGFLSDKLRRRKLFVAIGAAFFMVGAFVEAFAHSFVPLMIGALLMNLAIAAFNAVDQAIVIATLPSRAEAGRYMAIIIFAQKIPSALAPLLGAALITIGMVGGESNYTFLYLLGGVLALIGGLVVLFKVKGVR